MDELAVTYFVDSCHADLVLLSFRISFDRHTVFDNCVATVGRHLIWCGPEHRQT